MQFSKEEQLEIGKKIYDGTMTRYEVAEAYGISDDTARDYMRMYRDSNGLAPKQSGGCSYDYACGAPQRKSSPSLSDYEAMTKEELIRELIKARINEARLKKGYAVKGDGPEKEYIV